MLENLSLMFFIHSEISSIFRNYGGKFDAEVFSKTYFTLLFGLIPIFGLHFGYSREVDNLKVLLEN